MDASGLIGALDRFGRALPLVIGGVSGADARWRPADGSWSVLEIVTHLADEEVEDFRRRLELTLSDPAAPWPPIDPEGAALERRYNEGRLPEVVERFAAERRRSVDWLRSLGAVDWSRSHAHPTIGALAAGDLLTAWAAHDTLHLRQLAKRLHQLVNRDGAPHASGYAGRWPS